MNRRQGFWSPYVKLHGVLNESYPPPPRFFLVFLAAVSVVMLSGCATKSLGEAIKGNDVAAVRSYISSGKNLNQDYSANRGGLHTPLMMAALFAEDEISKLLIENGANINVPSFTSQRPICTFINRGKEEIVSLLIKKGVDINEECELGLTPLQKAAYAGQIEIVKLLIANGAKINYANKYGITAVTWAKKGGQQDVANYLVSKGGKQLSTNIDAAISALGEEGQAYALNRVNAEREQREEEEREQKRREKAESRAFWKGAATLATGVAVGNATRNLNPDQQTRMVSSAMKGVQSGDMGEFNATTQQVKAERTQEHNAKMQAIEAQKERDRAAQAQDNRVANANVGSYTPKLAPLSYPSSTKYRCVEKTTGGSFPKRTEAAARAEALQYTKIVEGGMGNLKTISTEITSCKHEEGLGFTCHALTKYERDSSVPCGGRSGPGGGKSK